MTSSRIRELAKLLIVAMLVSSLALPPPAVAQVKVALPGKHWTVKYEAGTEPIKKGTKLKVTVGQEEIVCESKQGFLFSIPVVGITEVSYDNRVQRRIAGPLRKNLAQEPFLPESQLIIPDWVGYVLLGVATVLIFYALKNTGYFEKHFVKLVWQEDALVKEVDFRVGRDEYKSFLAELRHVVGKPWKNLKKERETLEQELKREKNKKVSVRLGRTARVGDTVLQPRLYQIVLLEHDGNTGALYFFVGKKVKTRKIVAVALVEIVPKTRQVTDAQVIYERGEGGIPTVSEIRTLEKTLRFLYTAPADRPTRIEVGIR